MDILPQIIANSIIAGSVYALVAMGFSLIFGATKFFNLAHGVLAAIGGYAVFYFAKTLGLPVGAAIAIGIALAAAVGWLLEIGIYRRLRLRKASSMVLLVASLGAFTALQAVVAILFTSQFRTLANLIGETRIIHIGTAVITDIQAWIIASALVLVAGLWLLLTKTSFGRAVRAVSDDEEVSKIVGINTERIIGYVFIIGSAIAGLAGVLVGFDTGIEPTMGLPLLLKGVIAAIVGGMGNVYGAFLGAYLLGFAENFGIWHISGEWKDAIAFVILILFLLFKPEGILGRKR
jgi:branched-subunit amino acid ABC-type transport system permease component